jgi:hypothetical protein
MDTSVPSGLKKHLQDLKIKINKNIDNYIQKLSSKSLFNTVALNSKKRGIEYKLNNIPQNVGNRLTNYDTKIKKLRSNMGLFYQ